MDQTQKTPPSSDSTKPVYPSQQEGFIPLDFSSPVHRQNKNAQQRQHQQTPYFRQNHNRNNYQNNRNKDCQQNNFRQSDGDAKYEIYSNQGNNSRGFYQQNNRNNFRNNNRGRRGNGGHGSHNVNVDISQYIHSSMIEDPWRELLERHNAMKGDNEDESKNEKSECNSATCSTDE